MRRRRIALCARPHLDGFAGAVTTLVIGAGAADVETVIVEGELI